MQKYHIIQVKNIGPTNANAARVHIKSERFEQWIIIPYANEPGSPSPAIETAVAYLEKKGHKIIGKGEGKDNYYLISNTFEPIK